MSVYPASKALEQSKMTRMLETQTERDVLADVFTHIDEGVSKTWTRIDMNVPTSTISPEGLQKVIDNLKYLGYVITLNAPDQKIEGYNHLSVSWASNVNSNVIAYAN